jgi:phage FluMu protein Com
MDNIRIRCKNCNKELEGLSGKSVSCGCPNMATIRDNTKITALDLSNVVMLNSYKSKQSKNVLTNEDIAWQEARRQRKVRKLDFEVR